MSKRLTLDEAFTPASSSLPEETKPRVSEQGEQSIQIKQASKQVSNHASKQAIGVARKEITIRLQQENWDRLERTAMNRKLNRIEPYSKQDIMEVALIEWLERNDG